MQQRIFATAALGVLCVSAWAAESKTGFQPAGVSHAERRQILHDAYDSQVAIWIWTDKYVYSPGESLTLRWTVQANNDYYPYTIFAYRVNNQTGARTFLPGNSGSATDIFGRTAEQGFNVMRMTDAEKSVLVGSNGSVLSSPLSLPNEPGMHTMTVELRDFTATRVIKTAYFKIGIVMAIDDLPSNITEDLTLTNDRAYRIRGIVSVRNNATLTIDPGTFLIGMPGSQPPSVLLIATNGRLVAEGTRTRPIIMTSNSPFGQRQRGDWGGLILLGDAPINDPGGELTIEGLPELPETRYGGSTADHNCGSLRYVRVEFAGALLRPNEETNSFTWGGCGTQTRSEYLQAHYGLDDSFEWFGGNNDARYLVGTYGADDYIDVQIGYTGRIQHVLSVSNADLSNRAVEADNYERSLQARPRGVVNLWNATFAGNHSRGFDESDSPCLYPRRGAGAIMNNIICLNWTTRGIGAPSGPQGVESLQPAINEGNFSAAGLIFWGNGSASTPAAANTLEGQVQNDLLPWARSEHAQSVMVADPMLRRPFVLNDPDFRPLTGSPALFPGSYILPPGDSFYDQTAKYIGAFGETDWTEEWTMFIQEPDLAP